MSERRDDLDSPDEEAFIDDLFQFEEEPPPRQRRESSGVGWWIRSLLVAAALAAVTVFGLRMFGFTIPIPAVVAGWLALLLLRKVTGALVPPTAQRARRRTVPTEDGTYNFTERDGLRVVVARWERLLERAGSGTEGARATHRGLVELADERLRQRHGITRSSDPTRAKTLLGESLWSYLATPPTRNLAPRDAAAYVQSLERL